MIKEYPWPKVNFERLSPRELVCLVKLQCERIKLEIAWHRAPTFKKRNLILKRIKIHEQKTVRWLKRRHAIPKQKSA